MSVFATSIGALTAAAYSTFCKLHSTFIPPKTITHHITQDGRRPVYLIALPFSILGSIGVAFARDMPELLFWRFWQTFGASPGFAVGAGVVGDIYKLEERGTAMGIFFAVMSFLQSQVSYQN